MIISTATSCCTERLIANLEEKLIGGITHVFGEIAGNNTPRYRANPIATAAIVPVWITRNSVQPYKNPHSGENASRRYTYCPPACGKSAASSPYDSAAAIVRQPLKIHVSSSPPADPVCRAMSAATMKIPDPIIEPTTIIVASYSP